jgi:hypothetical protein
MACRNRASKDQALNVPVMISNSFYELQNWSRHFLVGCRNYHYEYISGDHHRRTDAL